MYHLPHTMSSSSASRVEGSGIGPSMVQRLDSYFVRMKFSILASDGTCPGASFASQYLFALAFPHFNTLCSCSSVQVSRSTDLTLLMCVPMPRCMPEQRMHMKTPRFQLAHRGSATCQHTSARKNRLERTLVSLAISACLVTLELYQVLQGCTILFRTISGRVGPPRHGGVLSCAAGSEASFVAGCRG
jgi:hypothetical protein